jgi:hypothetical protein
MPRCRDGSVTDRNLWITGSASGMAGQLVPSAQLPRLSGLSTLYPRISALGICLRRPVFQRVNAVAQPAVEELVEPGRHGLVVDQPGLELGGTGLGARQFEAV